ncbi:MAG: hypothetical protein GVY10_02675 [Verrucomicrobia bacterium]|jgi:hypothetical protein|nr:hypothetical protein [Verrucomicrobiota bacterium]
MKTPIPAISPLCLLAPALLSGQDPYPEPIPYEGEVVMVEEVATIPDSTSGNPPRMSVVTTDPAGRLFVNDQRGPLYLVRPDSGNVELYLDLRSYPELDIVATWEAGFQSFAFHPDFADPGKAGYGRFYTIHSCGNTDPSPDFSTALDTGFDTLLLEWRTDDPDRSTFVPADGEQPYREVLRIRQPYGNHNAGLIAFRTVARPGDPAYGLLYAAIGDGGSGGDPQENAEDPGNPFGAILRIDPLGNDSPNGQYGIPPENALAADGDAQTLGEIYAYGLRNPQRFAWDLVTGNGYIADIGQNSVEEINLLANGAHYGWDLREGRFAYEGGTSPVELTDPIAAYDHSNTFAAPPVNRSSRAVTTGEVARGTLLPSLEGHLLLADFPAGILFALDLESGSLDGSQTGLREIRLRKEGGAPVRFLDLINASRSDRGLGTTSRTDLRFSIGTPGQIYLSNKQDGVLRRIVPEADAEISLAPSEQTPVSVQFEGILQRSTDLESWTTLIPQPQSPYEVNSMETPLFLRSVEK